MADMMRKMLDELMGTNRDGAQGENAVKFTNPEVCKSYLLGLCPYDLFHNTGSFKSSKKLDLGICTKVHDPALKADYEIGAKEKDYAYEPEQLEQLTQFIGDCDRKVAVNKKRLEETQDKETLGPEAQAVHELNEQIGIKLSEAEELGAEGNVEESIKIMAAIEELKQDKRKAEDIYRNTVPATTNQQQKLRVCEICAAFLSLYDNDRRLADHFGGRLHMGFISVRERMEELQGIVAEQRKAREKEREKVLEEQGRDRERRPSDRDRRESRSDRDGGGRDRDSGRRDKERDRERDRDRDSRRRSERDRDRDRDRKRRSRSRSRDKDRRRRRSRSHDRRRDRSRDRSRDRRRDRSRDRSREKESHEKDRESSRSRDDETRKEKTNIPEDGEVLDPSMQTNNKNNDQPDVSELPTETTEPDSDDDTTMEKPPDLPPLDQYLNM